MKNKLPRKRKKALIKKEGLISYIAAQVANDTNFEYNGYSDWKFPKLGKYNHRKGNYDILGYW